MVARKAVGVGEERKGGGESYESWRSTKRVNKISEGGARYHSDQKRALADCV